MIFLRTHTLSIRLTSSLSSACVCVYVEEDQETSGDFGSGGAVILLDDQEESPQRGRGRQKERRGRLHPRGAIEDDEDGEDDEIGYVW